MRTILAHPQLSATGLQGILEKIKMKQNLDARQNLPN